MLRFHDEPVRTPQAGRFTWHKLYSSQRRRGEPEKAAKDRTQAQVMAMAMGRDHLNELEDCVHAAPRELKVALAPMLGRFAKDVQEGGPEVHDAVLHLRPR